jgi:dienelactone hydrolase
LLRRRLLAGLAAAKALPIVDAKRIAVIGFCFGGLCALDFARANADVRGVVSIHGLLKPSGLTEPKIAPRVLMLHGYDDPLAPPEDVLAVAREFTAAGADWQLHAYGDTVHAFTNPSANDRAGGMQYDEAADRRSWHALEEFLGEVLK